MNEVHNDQHVTKPAQMIILPENQDDHSLFTPKGYSKSLASVTSYQGHPRKNLVTLTSYLLRK